MYSLALCGTMSGDRHIPGSGEAPGKVMLACVADLATTYISE